jgi:thioredoxin 2
MNVTYAPCPSCNRLNRISLEQSAAKEPICGGCKSSLHVHFGIVEVSGTGLRALVEKSPLPVVCDFWAPWCGPCKSFAPVFQQAARLYEGKIVFAKLNTEQHQLAGEAFRVRSIPTLIAFGGGLERNRISGALPLDSFREWLDSSLLS